MTKIALSLLALAALSTASLAEGSRENFNSFTGQVSVESAPLAVYGSTGGFSFNDGNDRGGHQGGRGR